MFVCLCLYYFVCIKVNITEKRREFMSPRPEQQLADYHREVRSSSSPCVYLFSLVTFSLNPGLRTPCPPLFAIEQDLCWTHNIQSWSHLICFCKIISIQSQKHVFMCQSKACVERSSACICSYGHTMC